jgi:MFS family permease
LHLLASNLLLFIAARALLGAAEGFFFVAALASGSDLAPPARRGEALSFLSLSLYLGIAIGPPIGEALISMAGGSYDAAWIAAAGVAGVAVILAWLTPESAPAVVAHQASRVRAPLIHPAGLLPGLIVLLGFWGWPAFSRSCRCTHEQSAWMAREHRWSCMQSSLCCCASLARAGPIATARHECQV